MSASPPARLAEASEGRPRRTVYQLNSGRPTIRTRLARMLEQQLQAKLPTRGQVIEWVEVDPRNIWSYRGRRHWSDDSVGSWGVAARVRLASGIDMSVMLGSYETMTDCVRARDLEFAWRGSTIDGAETCWRSGVDVFAAAGGQP